MQKVNIESVKSFFKGKDSKEIKACVGNYKDNILGAEDMSVLTAETKRVGFTVFDLIGYLYGLDEIPDCVHLCIYSRARTLRSEEEYTPRVPLKYYLWVFMENQPTDATFKNVVRFLQEDCNYETLYLREETEMWLYLRYNKEMSFEEIAGKYNISAKTVEEEIRYVMRTVRVKDNMSSIVFSAKEQEMLTQAEIRENKRRELFESTPDNEITITDLGLEVRPYNALLRADVTTVEDLKKFSYKQFSKSFPDKVVIDVIYQLSKARPHCRLVEESKNAK